MKNIYAGTAGVVGIGGAGAGMMVAEMACAPPFYCNSLSGKCCLAVFNFRNAFECPDTC